MTSNHEEFNDDELKAPEWLDKEFLLKVLRHCENDSEIDIMTFKITPGTGKGDHYASIIFRVVINYLLKNEEKTKSLIIKLMPEVEGHKKEMLQESFIFETEIAMYTEMIPKLEKILQDVGDNTKLSAPCLYYALSPKKLIVFEDLVPLGYTVIRHRDLTIEEVKTVYMKIAKWHAITYKMTKENPSLLDKYCHSVYRSPAILGNPMFKSGIKNIVTSLEEIPSLRKYVPHFKALESTFMDSCIASAEEYRQNPRDDAFYVLCHGDFHLKNIMFKSNPDNDEHEDALLLDFQFSYVGPVAMDLHNSFFGFLNEEQRKNHFDELLYYYFQNFIETLKKTGFKGDLPKLAELRNQLSWHSNIANFMLVCLLPMVHALRNKEAGLAEIVESQDKFGNLLKSKSYIEELEWLLPKFLHQGYLEN